MGALYEEQRRYTLGQWSFESTLWSKVTYRLAKARGKLRPAPVPGKHNMERNFEQRIKRAAKRLVSLKLASWRNVKPPEAPSKLLQGYKRHKSRGKDLFLTAAGLTEMERRLHAAGVMAEPGMASCESPLEPTGPIPEGLTRCDE